MRFNVMQKDEKWFAQPENQPSLEEFKSLLPIMKSKGGKYSKGGFLFAEDPSYWINETSIEETPTTVEPAQTDNSEIVVESKEKVTIDPEIAELAEHREQWRQDFIAESKALTEEEEKSTEENEPQKGIEFEVHKSATIEECEQKKTEILSQIDEDDCKDHHEILLNLLVEECKVDDTLRAEFTRKEYMKTFNSAGRAAVNALKKPSISPKKLFPFIVAAYKKAEIKTTTVPKTTATKKTTVKKTTRKKATAKK